MAKKNTEKSLVHAWFFLTHHERLFLAGILAILLLGITARYYHLKNQESEVYEPTATAMEKRDE